MIASAYLIDQSYVEPNSPKTVMRQAYADGLVSDSAAWAELLNDRYLSSHFNDETTAAAIFKNRCHISTALS
ncbi:MAG: nucleotidyltransferase substrate binding protein [Oscillospiraceae bacterium]